MSLNINDEFVVFPSESGNGVTTLDVGYLGSHDPGCLDDCGQQHCPTKPSKTLRYSKVDDAFEASGRGREGRPSVVSASSSTGGPQSQAPPHLPAVPFANTTSWTAPPIPSSTGYFTEASQVCCINNGPKLLACAFSEATEKS